MTSLLWALGILGYLLIGMWVAVFVVSCTTGEEDECLGFAMVVFWPIVLVLASIYWMIVWVDKVVYNLARRVRRNG